MLLPWRASALTVFKVVVLSITFYMIYSICVKVKSRFSRSTRSGSLLMDLPVDDEDANADRIPPTYTNPLDPDTPFAELKFKEWLNSETWEQDDPKLVAGVRQRFLIAPSDKPYNVSIYSAVKMRPFQGHIPSLESLLQKLSPGFFIEAGANDGEISSNTLWLEKEFKWKGLLIEADPYVFRSLLQKRRKAWAANVCLSGSDTPKQVTFYRNPMAPEFGGLIYDANYGAVIPIPSQSIPLYTILLGLNRTSVDYLSLDVNGNELQILNTIPFDSVTFKVLHISYLFLEEGKNALYKFMKTTGYKLYKTVKRKGIRDSIFVHPSLLVSK